MVDFIEIAYTPSNAATIIKKVAFSSKMSVADALSISGILDTHPEVKNLDVGVFRKLITREHILKPGDRVEIYRPLKISPMEKRRRKAK